MPMMCPYCRSSVDQDESLVCKDCGSTYHVDCFQEAGSCVLQSCSGLPTAEATAAAIAADLATPRTTTCQQCGSILRPGVRFCTECGTPAPAAPSREGMLNCPRCNGLLKQGSRFCIHCGVPVQLPMATSSSEPGTPEVPPVAESAEPHLAAVPPPPVETAPAPSQTAKTTVSEIPEPSPQPSITDQLSRLVDLREQGVLTEEEFSKAKAKLLD